MQKAVVFLQYALLVTEFLAAVVSIFYLIKLKHSYWKWFSIYLIIIFIQEVFWRNATSISYEYRLTYFTLFGIPLQFVFFYWLYALKSLKSRRLFLISTSIFIAVTVSFLFFKELNEVSSLSSNTATIILIVLLILEFIKQVKTDEILKFRENKMFYINLGMVLFYIGGYPYNVFGKELHENYYSIWSIYNIYFLVTNCLIYLLFSASFIWGKTQS